MIRLGGGLRGVETHDAPPADHRHDARHAELRGLLHDHVHPVGARDALNQRDGERRLPVDMTRFAHHGGHPRAADALDGGGKFAPIARKQHDLVAAAREATDARFDALIALGAVVRGQTPHFEYVAGECASGLSRIALESGVPVAFGVLTTETMEQAVDRAGGKAGNKGADAALAAIEMANLLRRLDA